MMIHLEHFDMHNRRREGGVGNCSRFHFPWIIRTYRWYIVDTYYEPSKWPNSPWLFIAHRLEHPVGIWEVIILNWCWDSDSYVVSRSRCFKNLHLSLYIYHLLCVTTPMSPITFGWSNWHMMDASDKKSFWFFSLEPGWNEREDQRCNISLTCIVFYIYSYGPCFEYRNNLLHFSCLSV